MAKSEILEMRARRMGFYAFNRWARRNGVPIDAALCVVRNVFTGTRCVL